jgi:hypothetical protein
MAHVLAWAVEHDLDTAVRLVRALSMWWVLRGRLAGQEPLLRELAGRAEPGSDGWCAAQFWLARTAEDAPDLPAALERLLSGAENAYRVGLFAASIVPTGNVDEVAWSAAAPCR